MIAVGAPGEERAYYNAMKDVMAFWQCCRKPCSGRYGQSVARGKQQKFVLVAGMPEAAGGASSTFQSSCTQTLRTSIRPKTFNAYQPTCPQLLGHKLPPLEAWDRSFWPSPRQAPTTVAAGTADQTAVTALSRQNGTLAVQLISNVSIDADIEFVSALDNKNARGCDHVERPIMTTATPPLANFTLVQDMWGGRVQDLCISGAAQALGLDSLLTTEQS